MGHDPLGSLLLRFGNFRASVINTERLLGLNNLPSGSVAPKKVFREGEICSFGHRGRMKSRLGRCCELAVVSAVARFGVAKETFRRRLAVRRRPIQTLL
jgi:hypothetical protein